MGKVVAVCVSKEKGTRKTNVGAAKLLRDCLRGQAFRRLPQEKP